jgi:hypothetical protein
VGEWGSGRVGERGSMGVRAVTAPNDGPFSHAPFSHSPFSAIMYNG